MCQNITKSKKVKFDRLSLSLSFYQFGPGEVITKSRKGDNLQRVLDKMSLSPNFFNFDLVKISLSLKKVW